MKEILGYPNYFVDEHGDVYSKAKGFLKKMKTFDSYGYRLIQIGGKKNYWTVKVHILVCIAFHGPKPKNKTMVAHYNGIRHDNRPENLRWATNSENMLDRRRHGTHLYAVGTKNSNCRLTEYDALLIRRLKSEYFISDKDLSKWFEMSVSSLNNIVKRRSWKHI